MKYLSLAFTAAVVAADTYKFYAVSEAEAYDGLGLFSLQLTSEGIDYVFLNEEALVLEYNEESKDLRTEAQVLTISGQYLRMDTRTMDVAEVSIVDDLLQFPGTTWACPVEEDPNGMKRDNLVFVNASMPFEGCEEITFRAVKENDGEEPPSSSEPPTSSEPETSSELPEPPTSSEPTSEVPEPPTSSEPEGHTTTAWNPTLQWNTTLSTFTKTLTTYTLYCTEETTITLTTCDHHYRCHPTTVTVTKPTTITVDDCLPPTTTYYLPTLSTTSPKPTTKPTSKPTSTPTSKPISKPTSTATVTTYDAGAAHAVPFIAGVAGLAALLV